LPPVRIIPSFGISAPTETRHGEDRKLVYRGQMDDSRPGSDVEVTGKDLRAALDAALAGKPLPAGQKPSLGCNIKWRPGNEPESFG
jgi:hypothetical protein